MLMLYISTNIETSVMLCLTAKLRGLQEARLCLAAEGGSVSAPKGLQDGARLRSVRTSALVLIVSALTLNTCQPACYLQLVSEGDMGEVSISRWTSWTVRPGRLYPTMLGNLRLQQAWNSWQPKMALLCSLRCNKCPLWECDSFLCCSARSFFLISELCVCVCV